MCIVHSAYITVLCKHICYSIDFFFLFHVHYRLERVCKFHMYYESTFGVHSPNLMFHLLKHERYLSYLCYVPLTDNNDNNVYVLFFIFSVVLFLKKNKNTKCDVKLTHRSSFFATSIATEDLRLQLHHFRMKKYKFILTFCCYLLLLFSPSFPISS